MWAWVRLTGSSGRDMSPYLCCRKRTQSHEGGLLPGFEKWPVCPGPHPEAAGAGCLDHISCPLVWKTHPEGERTLDPQGHPDRCCHAELFFSLSLCHCESSQPLGLPHQAGVGGGIGPAGGATSSALNFASSVLILFLMLLHPPYTGTRQTHVLLLSFSFYERIFQPDLVSFR